MSPKEKNTNFDELKSQIVTNLKKINCDKPPRSNCNNLKKCVKKKLQTLNITKLKYLINRPGVAGAVLQTPSAIHPFSSNLQNIITPNQLQRGT